MRCKSENCPRCVQEQTSRCQWAMIIMLYRLNWPLHGSRCGGWWGRGIYARVHLSGR